MSLLYSIIVEEMHFAFELIRFYNVRNIKSREAKFKLYKDYNFVKTTCLDL